MSRFSISFHGASSGPTKMAQYGVLDASKANPALPASATRGRLVLGTADYREFILPS